MRTVLLIDDDEDDRNFFVEALNFLDKNIQAWTATDGQDALDMLQYTLVVLPEVIFLDLNMPKMNGIEFLRQIKQINSLKNIPVVVYTTSSNPEDVKKTQELGATEFLTKPSDSRTLYQRLTSVLNKYLVPVGNC